MTTTTEKKTKAETPTEKKAFDAIYRVLQKLPNDAARKKVYDALGPFVQFEKDLFNKPAGV